MRHSEIHQISRGGTASPRACARDPAANSGGRLQRFYGRDRTRATDQFVKDDLPAEWLPMRRHVMRSRGGRMFVARSSRSCGSCCTQPDKRSAHTATTFFDLQPCSHTLLLHPPGGGLACTECGVRSAEQPEMSRVSNALRGGQANLCERVLLRKEF
jgi:hypothetical protein